MIFLTHSYLNLKTSQVLWLILCLICLNQRTSLVSEIPNLFKLLWHWYCAIITWCNKCFYFTGWYNGISFSRKSLYFMGIYEINLSIHKETRGSLELVMAQLVFNFRSKFYFKKLQLIPFFFSHLKFLLIVMAFAWDQRSFQLQQKILRWLGFLKICKIRINRLKENFTQKSDIYVKLCIVMLLLLKFVLTLI